MVKVQKNQGKVVKAWQLGAGSNKERELISEGKIKVNGESYELFSQECKSGQGEIAQNGDYFKVDEAGYPYPNRKAWFEENHTKLEGEDEYEQAAKPLDSWEADQEMCPEVQFLVDHKGLKLDPDNPDQFFGAELWGAWLTAPVDAVLIFYSISRDEAGNVTDASFNFVARAEFDATYHYCS